MTIQVFIDLPNGERRACHAEEGRSLLSLAQANGVDLEGACESSLACATCHLVIDAVWYGKLPPPSVEERDMLDLAPQRTKTSRLSCQVRLTEALHGLVAKVPK